MGSMQVEKRYSVVEQDSYLPSFADLVVKMPFLANGNERQVAKVPVRFLRFLLTEVVSRLPFDEGYYARSNPDVVQAIAEKKIEYLHEHFVRTGYFEGRLPAARFVDRAWYLQTYTDVARAYALGQIVSIHDHYNNTGINERRAGSALQFAEKQKWESEINEAVTLLQLHGGA